MKQLQSSAGADVIVAQGTEAGGHTGTMTLLPLLAGVAEAFPDVPLLAACAPLREARHSAVEASANDCTNR